jgi:hypothetical protein
MSTLLARAWRSVAAVGVFVALAGGASAQDKKPETGNQDEIRALLTLTDEAASGKATNSLAIKWEQNHFIKSHGDKTYVPFTVSLDAAAFTAPTPVGLYLRVAKRGELPPTDAAAASKDSDKKKKGKKDETKGAGSQIDARHEYPFEDVFFIDIPAAVAGQPQLLRRAFSVSPGDYDVYIAVKEKPVAGATASPKVGVLKHELTVPSLDGDFTTSTVIIAAKIDVLQTELAPERQAENPYTFSTIKISPSLDNKFKKTDEFNIMFWIYGAAADASKKPNIEVEYAFHQKTAEGEKFFNKTDPQIMNAETLPPQFDLAAGHQLTGSLAVPLASFPPGDYRLEVKITDKAGSKSVTREATFSVAAQ